MKSFITPGRMQHPFYARAKCFDTRPLFLTRTGTREERGLVAWDASRTQQGGGDGDDGGAGYSGYDVPFVSGFAKRLVGYRGEER